MTEVTRRPEQETASRPREPLVTRALSGLLLTGLVVGALVADVYWIRYDVLFALIWAASMVIVLREFYALSAVAGTSPFHRFGLACGMLLILLTWLSLDGTLTWLASAKIERAVASHLVPAGLVVAVLGTLLLQATKRDNDRVFESISSTLFGLLYVWFLPSFALRLRRLDAILGGSGAAPAGSGAETPAPDLSAAAAAQAGGGDWLVLGTWLVVAMVAATKVSDIAAFFGGRRFGRHGLIRRISPGKTWEGAAAGFLGGIGAAVLVWWLARETFLSAGFTLGEAVIFGAVLSVVGQLGDLAESLMKRGSGRKDSGGLVPGYGGLFDVADSLITACPVAYFLTMVMLR